MKFVGFAQWYWLVRSDRWQHFKAQHSVMLELGQLHTEVISSENHEPVVSR